MLTHVHIFSTYYLYSDPVTDLSILAPYIANTDSFFGLGMCLGSAARLLLCPLNTLLVHGIPLAPISMPFGIPFVGATLQVLGLFYRSL